MVRLILLLCLSIEGIALFFYNKTLFLSKKNIPVQVIYYVLAYLFVFFSHGFSSYYSIFFNILVFFVANVFLISFLYEQFFVSVLIHALLLSGISIISEVIVGNLTEYLTSNFWSNWNNDHNLIILGLSSVLYSFLILSAAFIEKRLKTLGKLEIMIIPIALLSVISFLAIIFNFLNYFISNLKESISMLNICFYSILLLGDVLIYIYMYRTGIELSQQRQQYQVEKDYVDFIKEIRNRDFEQRVLIHDIKKHLASITQLYNEGNEQAFKEYIEKVISAPILKSSIRYCDNDFINAIINRYQKDAQNRGIEFEVNSNAIELSFLDNYDITVILCNIFENAIEAAEKSPAPSVLVTFSADYEKQLSIITLVNACKDTLKFSNGIPVTSKKDNYSHGLGMKSVNRIIEKYNGTIDMYQDDNNYIHTIILLNWREENENSNL
jgi:signal transduction histidine kinase